MISNLFLPYLNYPVPTVKSAHVAGDLTFRMNLLPGIQDSHKFWTLDTLQPKRRMPIGNLLASAPCGAILGAIGNQASWLNASRSSIAIPLASGIKAAEVISTFNSNFVIRCLDGSILHVSQKEANLISKKPPVCQIASSSIDPLLGVSVSNRLSVLDLTSGTEFVSFVSPRGVIAFKDSTIFLAHNSSINQFDLNSSHAIGSFGGVNPAAISFSNPHTCVYKSLLLAGPTQVVAVTDSLVHVFDIRSTNLLYERVHPYGDPVFARRCVGGFFLSAPQGLHALKFDEFFTNCPYFIDTVPSWEGQVERCNNERREHANDTFSNRVCKNGNLIFSASKTDSVESSIGVDCVGASVFALSCRGNLFESNSRRTEIKPRYRAAFFFSPPVGQFVSKPMPKFDFSKNTNAQKISPLISFFILAEIGVCALRRCKAEAGSFAWNALAKKIPVSKILNFSKIKKFKITSLVNLRIKIAHKFGEQIELESIKLFLTQLAVPSLELLEDCVIVNPQFEEPLPDRAEEQECSSEDEKLFVTQLWTNTTKSKVVSETEIAALRAQWTLKNR